MKYSSGTNIIKIETSKDYKNIKGVNYDSTF